MIARPGADITDVYAFPSPANANNVVLVMDVHPLIAPGQGTSTFFYPAVLYQFKMVHGPFGTTAPEDTVIQFTVNGTDANQTLTMYGPTAPAQTGTQNTLAGSAVGTVKYNAASTIGNGIQVFAGPRADPFFFDLFAFFNTLQDRNAQFHPPISNPSPVPSPGAFTYAGANGSGVQAGALKPFSFRGFAAGNPNGCDTSPAVDALSANKFNVLSIVVEMPKTLLQTSGQPSTVHLWATTSTQSGS